MATIMMVGAFDTKGVEYAFLREQILARGHEVLAVNTGVMGECEAFAVERGCQRGGGGWRRIAGVAARGWRSRCRHEGYG